MKEHKLVIRKQLTFSSLRMFGCQKYKFTSTKLEGGKKTTKKNSKRAVREGSRLCQGIQGLHTLQRNSFHSMQWKGFGGIWNDSHSPVLQTHVITFASFFSPESSCPCTVSLAMLWPMHLEVLGKYHSPDTTCSLSGLHIPTCLSQQIWAVLA